MARKRPKLKPLKDLSPAYRKRLTAAAKKAGTTPGKLRRSQAATQAARGHRQAPGRKRPGEGESARRRAKFRAEYGTTPERLNRLRQAARDNMVARLRAAGTRGYVNIEEIERGLRAVPASEAAALYERIAAEGADEIKRLAGLTYEQFIAEYPELANDEKRNPYWYHGSGGGSYARAA